MIRVLIDATNIISGGGVSHLIELLNNTTKNTLEINRIESVIIVGVQQTLEKINDQEWLLKIPMAGFEGSVYRRQYWKLKNLKNIAKEFKVDIIFNPGGAFYANWLPYVTMCRNMLVFETKEANRYGFTLYRLKFVLLRFIQSLSMKKAAGVIFISRYAQLYVKLVSKLKIKKDRIIHHGISDRFRKLPKKQIAINFYSDKRPFKILYISTIDAYKHHDKLARAVIELSKKYPVELTVIGGKARGFKAFQKVASQNPRVIKYLGNVNFSEIHYYYQSSDIFAYASTCENMPNILIEAMSAGLPIACSNKQPMPEFLKDAGIYFEAEDTTSIKNAIEKLIMDPNLRAHISNLAYHYSEKYSWITCANETFEFISSLAVK